MNMAVEMGLALTWVGQSQMSSYHNLIIFHSDLIHVRFTLSESLRKEFDRQMLGSNFADGNYVFINSRVTSTYHEASNRKASYLELCFAAPSLPVRAII
jgi:hypothetical protein